VHIVLQISTIFTLYLPIQTYKTRLLGQEKSKFYHLMSLHLRLWSYDHMALYKCVYYYYYYQCVVWWQTSGWQKERTDKGLGNEELGHIDLPKSKGRHVHNTRIYLIQHLKQWINFVHFIPVTEIACGEDLTSTLSVSLCWVPG